MDARDTLVSTTPSRTLLLVDKDAGVVISLLTNRVSPSRDGDDATGLRKAVSDVVYSAKNDFN